ncbi:MAG: glycosyltransferase [Chromatiaceae bacterium]|nr:glycosyltransferase [Chromatiaceae bacterium]
MKILHVEAGMHLYGGARQVLYLLEGLAERGVENLLVVPTGSAVGAKAGSGTARVEYIRMAGDLDLGVILRLYRIIRRESPDLVHLHSRRGADLLGGVAARLAGVPALLTRRVDNPESRWLVGAKYRLYRGVITISEGIRQVLLRQGVPAEKLSCVRSAVEAANYTRDCDRDWFLHEFGLEPEARAIGVVAQLIPRKGHRFLLQAMVRLVELHPELHLLLFGKGPLEAELGRLIESLGLAQRVTLAGFRDDLAKLFPCLELLVHPALIEGLGVALLQAASAGVPIVASHTGGIPEAVRDGVNGLLVPPGQPEALVDALDRLLQDRALARRLGDAGRELMQREFSVAGMVEGNLALYQTLLNKD